MADTIRAVIVETSFLLRSGLERLLDELSGILVVANFDGSEKRILDKIRQQKPDLVLVNPDALGNDFLQLCTELQSDTQIKLVGMLDEHTALNVQSRFPHNLNIKDGKHELMEQIRKISGNSGGKSAAPSQSLSSREAELLKHIALGLTNQEVADKLFLSIHTVTTHRKNITKKLGIKTVSGLTVYALMHKIVSLKEIEGK